VARVAAEAFDVKCNSLMDVRGQGKRDIKGKVIRGPCLGGVMGGRIG
jgi:hypothetical protein